MIQRETVQHVAKLARLELNEEEQVRFTDQLGHILEYVEQLREVDTEGVGIHAPALTNVLRRDESRPSLPREELLRNAPSVENGMFKVPRILD